MDKRWPQLLLSRIVPPFPLKQLLAETLTLVSSLSCVSSSRKSLRLSFAAAGFLVTSRIQESKRQQEAQVWNLNPKRWS